MCEQEAVSEEESASSPPTPRESLWGLWADLGPAPSDEDITEMRREAWARFGDEDNLDGWWDQKSVSRGSPRPEDEGESRPSDPIRP